MGLFDLLKGKKVNDTSREKLWSYNIESYREIAELLTADAEVLESLSQCFEDPETYYKKHAEAYEERGMGPEDDIVWFGIVDEMICQGAMHEFDYKEEVSEFATVMRELAKPFSWEDVREDWFEEEGDIPTWCETLEQKWSSQNIVVAAMDIDSDSYVIFLCDADKFQKLQRLAQTVNHRIDHAKNL